MATGIVLDPLLPWTVVVAVGALAATACAVAIWFGWKGGLFRLALAAGIFGAMLNPAWHIESRSYQKDIAIAVVDRTASQSIGGRVERTAAALEHIRAEVGKFENFELVEVDVADAPIGQRQGTRLFSALESELAELDHNRVAGIVFITDGRIHGSEPPPRIAAPMHALLTGSRNDQDLRLEVKSAPAFAVVDRPVSFVARVVSEGGIAKEGDIAEIVWTVNGVAQNSSQVIIGRDFIVEAVFANSGMQIVQMDTPIIDGELTAINNSVSVSINAVRDRLKVLLVSGLPHSGQRTWRNILKSDASVDLVHFTILRSPTSVESVVLEESALIAFPVRELFQEKINDFDLIIFDRVSRITYLPDIYFEFIRRYVESGGGLLIAVGPEFLKAESIYRTALSSIIPVVPTANLIEAGFKPAISEVGLRHPVTATLRPNSDATPGEKGEVEWGRWFRQVQTRHTSGVALMSGAEGYPLLVLDRAGDGRIAFLGSDQAWLWHRGIEGGGPQQELLRRLAHWLMGEPELEEEALSVSVAGSKLEISRRSLEDFSGTVRIEKPDGSASEIELERQAPGQYGASVDTGATGLHIVRNGGKTAVAVVDSEFPIEFAGTASTGEMLLPAVSATGGGTHWVEDGMPNVRLVHAGRANSGRNWLGLVPREFYTTTDIRLRPLFDALISLLVLLSLACAAWWRESR